MSVQLQNPKHNLIKTDQLQDGQLAVIVGYQPYEGLVVQRVGTRLQAVGKTIGHSWEMGGPTFKLRPLEVGETIEVTGN